MLKNYLMIFLVSMVPLIELRGAVPIAVWNESSFCFPAILSVFLGNMLPVPIIFFFSQEKYWNGVRTSRSSASSLPSAWKNGHKGGQKLQEKAGRGLFVALLLFVGIPLPGTGAWTGTLAASLLDMDFKSSVIAVMCGVVLAGVIMGLLSMGVFGALGTVF